jgi:EF-P beta-lysylation protein EpmB
MIARTAASCQIQPWQQALAQALTDPAELLAYLQLDPALLPAARRAARAFGLRVPRGYALLMHKGRPDDPLLRQVLPLAEEMQERPGFDPDPVGDLAATAVPGLLQKYAGRALLIATGACAVHCRYCFRRHFPYPDLSLSAPRFRDILTHLRERPDVTEVILSGGDPLVLSDRRLSELVTGLGTLPSLRRLRIHTRLPVVLPQRITSELLSALTHPRLASVIVIHANHPHELSAQVRGALRAAKDAGFTLLNQAVLLRGVNDGPDTLAALSEALFEAGVLPYYLHLLDRVQGAAHFEVDDARALELHRELRNRLPGYLVPRLVREQAREASKTPLV